MEVTRAAEASSAMQTVLETEIGEHEALKRAAFLPARPWRLKGFSQAAPLGAA